MAAFHRGVPVTEGEIVSLNLHAPHCSLFTASLQEIHHSSLPRHAIIRVAPAARVASAFQA
jgi:hypothetical protein